MEFTCKYDEIKRRAAEFTDGLDFYARPPGITPFPFKAYPTRPYSPNITFKLNVTSTTAGALQIPLVVPSIAFSGRQSKIIVTDYAFGNSSCGVYSTAQLFYAGTIDGRDVLFLHRSSSQAHKDTLTLTRTPNPVAPSSENWVSLTHGALGIAPGSTIVSFLPSIEGLVTVCDSDTQLVLYADLDTAVTFWAPSVALPSSTDLFRNYWRIRTNTSILVGGPYLIRNANIDASERALALQGDLKTDARFTDIAPRSISFITCLNDQVTYLNLHFITYAFEHDFKPRNLKNLSIHEAQ
ncbi:hypothetical protein C0991_001832 [Blastosporella zonata]|nr:hypothetical protein C0991_001832 [Blastosporella zonata]